MSLEDLVLKPMNESVLKKFKLFDSKKASNDGFVANHDDAITLFPEESEIFRRRFSITAQRTKFISKDEKKCCSEMTLLPIVYDEILSKKLNQSEDCMTLQLLNDGNVVGFCCFMLCRNYTVIRAFVAVDETRREIIGHCFYSIVEDIVLLRTKQVKPIITVSIECKESNCAMNCNLLQNKRSCILDVHNTPVSFTKEQKTLMKVLQIKLPCRYHVVNRISYIPTYMCNTHSVFRNNYGISSWNDLLSYCYKVILENINCNKSDVGFSEYSTEDSTRDWEQWVESNDNKGGITKWIEYVNKEKNHEFEKRCIEELLCSSSSTIHGRLQPFGSSKRCVQNIDNHDIFVIMSLIIFRNENGQDLFRQFFTALWFTMSISPSCVCNEEIIREYENNTLERLLCHMKNQGISFIDKISILDEADVNKLRTDFKKSNETRKKMLEFISHMYMDTSFPASLEDLTLILNIYNFVPLYIHTKEKQMSKYNNKYLPLRPCGRWTLKHKLKNLNVNVVGQNLKRKKLIIPITLCDVFNMYNMKVYSINCHKVTSNKLHRHEKKFLSEKKTWNVLPVISDNCMQLDMFPYKEYCCKPNHFQSSNKMICPVIPGRNNTFLSAVDYLKFLEVDIGSDLKISVIDVVKEVEVSWNFRQLITYFDTCNREKIFNQVSLEISFLPIGKKIDRPKFVEEIDWMNYVNFNKTIVYPRMQYYLITSVKGCFMDYHIDMSGTAVWYHVAIGTKEICLIKPTKSNLCIYESWLNPFNVNKVFLPDLINDKNTISYVKVCARQTLIIPSGYIHAVYTPEDSIVFGGNFLHSNNVEMQFNIYGIEQRKCITEQQRVAYFIELNLNVFDYILSMSLLQSSFQYDRKILLEIIIQCEEWIKNDYNSSELQSCLLHLLRRYAVPNMTSFFHMAIHYCENDFTSKQQKFLHSIQYVQQPQSISSYLDNYYAKVDRNIAINSYIYTFSVNGMYTSYFMCPVTGECFKSAPFVNLAHKVFRPATSQTYKKPFHNTREKVIFYDKKEFETDYYIFKTVHEAEDCAKAFAFDCFNYRIWFKHCIMNFVMSTNENQIKSDVCTQFTIQSPYSLFNEQIVSNYDSVLNTNFQKHCIKKSVNENIKNLNNNKLVFERFILDKSTINRRNNEIYLMSDKKLNIFQNLKVPIDYQLVFPFSFDLYDVKLQHLNYIWFQNIYGNSFIIPSESCINTWVNTNGTSLFHIKNCDANRLSKNVDSGQLNDSLINFWMSWMLLMFDSSESSVHCCKSYMYSKLTVPSLEYERVKKWSNKKLFENSIIFVPIHVPKNHWIIAIIFNPGSVVKRNNEFSIIICDSIITGKRSANGVKERNQTIINNLLYWLREEWYYTNMSEKILTKRTIEGMNFEQYTERPFYSKGQENTVDCGLFVCLSTYQTIQWLLDSKCTSKRNSVNEYLNRVNQQYVNEFRKQFFELIICLEWKQHSSRKCLKVDSCNEDEDDDCCMIVDECDVMSLKTNNVSKGTNTVRNKKCQLIISNSFESTSKNSNNVDVKENVIKENDDYVIILDPCEITSVKTSNVNGTNAVTVCSDSVFPSVNMKSNMPGMDMSVVNSETNIESNFKGKEINMEVENDDISSVSASLDQSLATNTSRKRKAYTNLDTANKLNAIKEHVTIQYIRIVLTFTSSKEVVVKFLNGIETSYDFLQKSMIEHKFRWYFYCENTRKKNKNHRYTVISEFVLTSITNLKTVNDWKILAFELFKESRKKVSYENENDDVRDVDYLNNYQNRGKITAANVFYIDCEGNNYIIDNTYLQYQLYYYNVLKDLFYGISVTENDRTLIIECDRQWITDKHGLNFCTEIKNLWYDMNTNPFQHLYIAWPGYIIPYPIQDECICSNTTLLYVDNCLEVSPFVLVANGFHLIEKFSLAKIIFEDRRSYYKNLVKHRNEHDNNMNLFNQKSNKSKLNNMKQKFCRPFQDLTNICRTNKFKSIYVNNKFDLIKHHEKMSAEEMVIFVLKANGCYLCVTKEYILCSNIKHPLIYSKEVLDTFSYGVYIGLKEGIYICSPNVTNDYITKFNDKYDHTVFKITNFDTKGFVHVPKGISNSCRRVHASQSLFLNKIENLQTETFHNIRTNGIKRNNMERLKLLPIAVRKYFLLETELQKNKLIFFTNYTDDTMRELMKELVLPFELLQVTKDIFNIFNNCLGGQLFDKNGNSPIFILVPRKNAIAVNDNARKDTEVLKRVLTKYKVNIKRGSKRQGISTHYATFGTRCNRFKGGLSTKIALNDNGDEELLIKNFFDRADRLAKEFLPYGLIHCLKESKVMCNDNNCYELEQTKELNCRNIWSSIATTYNYMSPAHIDEDAFMSTLFVSHVHKDDNKNENTRYGMNQEVALYFCFPTEGVAVALRPGDVLFFNPVYYHCASQRCEFYKNEEIFLTSLYMKNKQLSSHDNDIKLTPKSEWFSNLSKVAR